MKKIILALTVVISNYAVATSGCISTTENGKKYCSQIMSSSSCQMKRNSTSLINGVKVINKELAVIKQNPTTRQFHKICVGRGTGEVVDYESGKVLSSKQSDWHYEAQVAEPKQCDNDRYLQVQDSCMARCGVRAGTVTSRNTPKGQCLYRCMDNQGCK